MGRIRNDKAWTEEYKKEYNKTYCRDYRGRFGSKKSMSSEVPLPDPIINEIPKDLELIFFKGDNELAMCQTFGCQRTLSLIENLAGNKCTQCMGKNKIDVNKFIQYPNKNIT